MKGIISRFYSAMAVVLTAVALFFGVTLSAIPSRPEPPRLVNDFAGILTEDQVDLLERRLVAYSDSTTTQIAVVIVNDLEGQDAASYAIQTHETWQVGSAENNNGALILVKPKNDNGSGEVFISIGYGLEGAIPDARTKRIINEVMIPHFIEDDYFGAIQGACEKIIRLADGEEFSDESENEASGIIGGAIFLGIFILILALAMRKKGKGGDSSSGSTSTGGPTSPIYTGRSFSGGSSIGGGGFGGFGGGSTGGAGAGGKW